jgi:hypothetical protein
MECLGLLMLAAIIIALAALAKSGSPQRENTQMSRTFYRTKDGRADFGFSFERLSDGSIRPYIDSMPSYGSRDTGLHTTHRLTEGGRYYVCWDRPLRSVEEAKQVVALWSDLTQEYIKSGRTIDQQMRSRR